MINLNNVAGITLGIRYSRSFRIPDISGDIIDDILYHNSSPFSNDFFVRVQEQTNREKILSDTHTKNYLRINTDDLILGIEINENFEKQFKWINEDILTYFKERLFKEYQINNIHRIGIIYHHKVKKVKRLSNLVSDLTSNKIVDATNISISFSKKLPTSEALYRKNVNDYKNTIYEFFETKTSMNANLDYQYYFEPQIQDLRDCYTESIIKGSKDFLKNTYYPIISGYEP